MCRDPTWGQRRRKQNGNAQQKHVDSSKRKLDHSYKLTATRAVNGRRLQTIKGICPISGDRLNLLSNTSNNDTRWFVGGIAIAVLVAVAAIYWPVAHAKFVWDDLLDFQRTAWLRHGSDWQHFVLRKFNNWDNYFRPLGVALFTAEVRSFDVQPGPMHVVSLVIHLINTLLIGVLAARLVRTTLSNTQRVVTWGVPMLLYGLHPMLVEPVVWIGCQFDLLALLFMMLGWVLSLSVKRPYVRAALVAISFFLAACSKESAAAFPLVLVIFDWFALDTPRDAGKLSQLKALLRRNSLVYVAIIVTAVAYLALRSWALGNLVPAMAGDALNVLGRIQEVSFLYMRYLCMFVWPTFGMGPLHPVYINHFQVVSAWSVLTDTAAIALVCAGIALTIQRTYVGGLILAATFALLPVLHIVPTNFSDSLYHERYAMPGLAMACVWLVPSLRGTFQNINLGRMASIASAAALFVWMTLAVMNVRQTIPLWSDDLMLWQWALQENPNFIYAKDELISAYIDHGDTASARKIINELVVDNVACANCMLNAASLAIQENDLQRASFFLDRIKNEKEIYANKVMYRFYLTLKGELLILQGKPGEAEEVLQNAALVDSLSPGPQLALATALALQGKIDDAWKAEYSAISLLAPDERSVQLNRFRKLVGSLDHTAKDK
jgi:hypothetical protein